MAYPYLTNNQQEVYGSRTKRFQEDRLYAQPDDYQISVFDESRVAQVSLEGVSERQSLIIGDSINAVRIPEDSDLPLLTQSTTPITVKGDFYGGIARLSAMSKGKDPAFMMKHVKALQDFNYFVPRTRDGICVELMTQALQDTTLVPDENKIKYDYTDLFDTSNVTDDDYKLTFRKLFQAQALSRRINRGTSMMSLVTSIDGRKQLFAEDRYSNSLYTGMTPLPSNTNTQDIARVQGYDIITVVDVPISTKGISKNTPPSELVSKYINLPRRDVTVGNKIYTVETGALISTDADVMKRTFLIGLTDLEMFYDREVRSGGSYLTSGFFRMGGTLVNPQKSMIGVEYVVGVRSTNPADETYYIPSVSVASPVDTQEKTNAQRRAEAKAQRRVQETAKAQETAEAGAEV